MRLSDETVCSSATLQDGRYAHLHVKEDIQAHRITDRIHTSTIHPDGTDTKKF